MNRARKREARTVALYASFPQRVLLGVELEPWQEREVRERFAFDPASRRWTYLPFPSKHASHQGPAQ